MSSAKEAAAAAAGVPSVSEIRYWMEGSPFFGNQNEHGDEGATYLSYDVFLGLSVLGGFFALDHLYLRSPWTFLAKFFVNIFFFGVWWIYDALQAVFNSDVVKVYGLGVPGLGPMGIASGVLANPAHSAKHLRFFTYAAALFFGGIIGLDSFLVGDRQTGVMRLVSLLSMIGMPIALLWWAYKLFQFFTNTKAVVGQYSTYFGAAAGGSFSSQFPFLGWLLNPVEWLKGLVATVAEPVIVPITSTIQMGLSTVDGVVSTASKTLNVGREAISKGAEVVEQVTQGLGAATSVVPGAALWSSVTPEAVNAAVQSGGGSVTENLNALPFALLFTLLVISIVGVVRTLYHSRRTSSSSPRTNDVPPQPSPDH